MNYNGLIREDTMKLYAIGLIVMFLLPGLCLAQTPAAAPSQQPAKPQVKPAPVDCRRNQTWSQTRERCVALITCEKTKKPWTFRCLADGEYKNARLPDLYKRGFQLTEISSKGAYYFKEGR